ncbi:MAG: 2-C-methyl-D-erythritol 4-phosphate cytidylyltransferase [Deltaproteobacteria bacterium]
MKVSAIIVAAGSGTRFGAGVPKQFVTLAGRPLLFWSIFAFADIPEVEEIVAVIPEGHEETFETLLRQNPVSGARIRWCAGGATRQESVLKGLRASEPDIPWAAVHDGARPLVTREIIQDVLLAAHSLGAAIPGLPVADTVKLVDEEGMIIRTLERKNLILAQTPQVCRKRDLNAAYKRAEELALTATDEAGLLEAAGVPVGVRPGSVENIKITTRDDLILAEAILAKRDKALWRCQNP